MDDFSHILDLENMPLGKLFIGGEWVDSSSEDYLDVISPDSEKLIARVVSANEADVDKAVAAAREAFDHGPWPRMEPAARASMIRKLSDALVERADEIALCWSLQIGIPYAMSKNVAPFFAKTMLPYADIAETMEFVETREIPGAGAGFLAHEPVGVVAAISPWNVPLSTMLNKIGPALAAGCTTIMKPSPETPLEAYIVAQCAEAIGMPPGTINLINADRDVSDYLVRSADVDKVSFTGSVAAGQRIASVCGDRIARVTLELGGKSAAIVLDDYDLDKAATALVNGICGIAGQNCAALSRALVSRDRHDELVAKMTILAEQKRVGHTFDEQTEMGPVAMKRQLERIEQLIEIGINEGAELASGGKRPDHLDHGYFMEPTIFANVSNDMRIAQEEIFGPVICVIPYDTIDEAIAIANNSDFGLSGAVFTNDVEKAYDVARRMRTGTVGHNGSRHDFNIGFGGFKKSGIGREGGAAGIKGYLESKTILLDAQPAQLKKS